MTSTDKLIKKLLYIKDLFKNPFSNTFKNLQNFKSGIHLVNQRKVLKLLPHKLLAAGHEDCVDVLVDHSQHHLVHHRVQEAHPLHVYQHILQGTHRKFLKNTNTNKMGKELMAVLPTTAGLASLLISCRILTRTRTLST